MRLLCILTLTTTSFLHAADEIQSLTGPVSITSWGTYSLTVNYSADADRNLVLSLKDTSNNTAYGQISLTALSGTGTLDIDLNVTGNPSNGDTYIWEASLEGETGIKNKNISIKKFLNVSTIDGNTWLIGAPEGYSVNIISLNGTILKAYAKNSAGLYKWKAKISGVYIISVSKGKNKFSKKIIFKN